MNILLKIKSSIYSPIFYQKDLLNLNPSYSFKYFFALVSIVSVILTIILAIDFIPKTILFFDSLAVNILDYYPQELEIRIKNGEAETNVLTPYFLSFPSKLSQKPGEKFENLLVIDLVNNFTIEKFKEYKTVILLTKKNIVYYKDDQIVIEDLRQFPNFIINKEIVDNFVGKIDLIKKILIPFVIFAIFFVLLLVYTFKLAYLLIGAFLIMLVLKILKYNFSYKKCYQVGLHAMTLPILLFGVLRGFYLNISLPFVFSLLMLLVVLINFIKKDNFILIHSTQLE